MIMEAIANTATEALQAQAFDTDAVTAAFLAQLDCKDSSRALYCRALRQFFAWNRRTGRQLNAMQKADILAYRDGIISGAAMPDGKRRSSLTAASYLTAVKLFYTWLESEKVYPNIAASVKAPKRLHKFNREPLSMEQARAMIADSRQSGSLRDAAIVSLLLHAGLRTVEVVRANVEDLAMKCGTPVLYVQGKGHTDKDNFVALSGSCMAAIVAYLDTRTDKEPAAPLFACTGNNNRGGRLTTRTISHIAKEHLQAIGLDGREYTAHSLRHTYACARLQQTGDYHEVQMEMRHASPATTAMYTYHIEEQRRIEAAKRYNIDELY